MLSIPKRISIRSRLSAAIAALFLVILLIAAIGLSMLRNAESWLDSLHRETLAEVSDALSLSRNAANLASVAPFLLTVQLPFQLEAEAADLLAKLETLETFSEADPALALPISRMKVSISNLVRVSSPQSALHKEIALIDGELFRLQKRFDRLANLSDFPLEQRLLWAKLMQLTAEAIGAARSAEVIAIGEFKRRFDRLRHSLNRPLPDDMQSGLDEVDAVITGINGDLFALKHRALTAALDAENALFRIRQLSNQLTSYSAGKVAAAEKRLTKAQAQTTRNLVLAQNVILVLAVISSAVALITALFVSRYVAGNLRRIADGMRKLAAGDHQSELPRKTSAQDEIGQLFDAFGIFRANAQKLDRRTGQMQRQNTLFSRVFRNIQDGVAILSPTGTIEIENSQFRTLLRLPTADGQTTDHAGDLIEQSDFQKRSGEAEQAGIEEYVDSAGDRLELRQSQLPDGGLVWLLSETTQRKQIEERLEEIRRVESLGKVTGEVAHDFGNILSTISGNLHLLETNVHSQPSQHLTRIRTAVDLGVTLTERLLSFARKQHLDPEVTDVSGLLVGLAELLSIALPDHVDLELEPADQPILVRLDPGQLESAILNLCLNAGQSISDKGKISLTVRLNDKDSAEIIVEDDGCGMSPETMRRACEPFFSARSDGTGSGLGLSMVHGFIHQSGGAMEIDTQLGRGTLIRLNFPVYCPTHEADREDNAFRGQALVVDDMPSAATFTAACLSDMGFETTVATSFEAGQQALNDLSSVGLLVTDLNLDHGKSGLDLFVEALAQGQVQYGILVSSRLSDNVLQTVQSQDRLAAVPKPFDTQSLQDALRDIRQQ